MAPLTAAGWKNTGISPDIGSDSGCPFFRRREFGWRASVTRRAEYSRTRNRQIACFPQRASSQFRPPRRALLGSRGYLADRLLKVNIRHGQQNGCYTGGMSSYESTATCMDRSALTSGAKGSNTSNG